jgi:pimeloyl-ACP methyl ester carboxylesterase
LVEHLGLDRFHLLATAAGGIVALDYALTYPERVRALAVANSIGGIQDPEYLAVQHRLRPSQIQELPIELRELGPSYRGTNSDGTRRWIEIERTSRQGDTHGPVQEVQNPMTCARLTTMRVPTLIISGGADLLSPPALMRMLAAPIQGHQWACVPEAGHAAFWEDPEAWNRLVLDFLADK